MISVNFVKDAIPAPITVSIYSLDSQTLTITVNQQKMELSRLEFEQLKLAIELLSK